MAAVIAGQVHALGKTRQTEDRAAPPRIDSLSVAAQDVLLAVIALAQDACSPRFGQGVENIVHLPPRREQHQTAFVGAQQRRQQFHQFGGVRIGVAGFAAHSRQRQRRAGVIEGTGHHGKGGLVGNAAVRLQAIEAAQGGQGGRGQHHPGGL